MRQFFKFFTASCLGTIIGLGLLVLILFLVAGSLASQFESKVSHVPNSVLELKFDLIVPEKTNNINNAPFELTDKKYIGIYDYVGMIKQAAEDKNIKGIFLTPELNTMSTSEISIIRKALEEFKASGKFIYAYGKYMSQNAYYLSSVADSVFINPYGMVEFRGLSANITYFKKMLDNLQIDVDVFYAGQFKSATEPFRATSMSDANRLQVREYIEDQFDIMLQDLSKSRGLSIEKMRALANDWAGFNLDSSVAQGLIDGIRYDDEITALLKRKTGIENTEELKMINDQGYYTSVYKKFDFKSKDKVALVFLEGEIILGDEEAGVITDENYVKILDKIRKDDNVKSVVLRINSPGGSVLASENILRAIKNIQDDGKPVVVSMGRYAASGGYYIACFADSIFAQPGTLTGSIGVFSLIPNFGRFLDNKIGITFDTVNTTKSSGYFTGVHTLSEEEKQLMQTSVDKIYTEFVSKVAEGRSMDYESVHEVAQGRVWTGRKAQEIGLVDHLGYTEDALACAARMASLESYRIDEYPKVKDPLIRLMEEITGENTMVKGYIREELGPWYNTFQKVQDLRTMEGPQARLPFILEE
jgi:protease-4